MATQNLMVNKTTDGMGATMTTGGSTQVYAVQLKGPTYGAFVDVMIDVSKDGKWASVGSLTTGDAAKLLMLPAGCNVTASLNGAVEGTNVTVVISG